jgi:hypothetical protein
MEWLQVHLLLNQILGDIAIHFVVGARRDWEEAAPEPHSVQHRVAGHAKERDGDDGVSEPFDYLTYAVLMQIQWW